MAITSIYFFCIFVTWLCTIFGGSRKHAYLDATLTGLTVSAWSGLFFWASFRFNGVDFINYSSSFLGLGSRVPDSGYQLIEETFGSLGLGVYSIYLLSSILTIFVLVKYAQRLNLNTAFIFLMYMSHLAIVRDFAHIRIGIAINIFLLLMLYWESKYFFRYIVFILIASSIHIACVIFILPFLLQRVSTYMSSLSFAVIFICAALVAKYAILDTLLSAIPSARFDYLVAGGGYKNIVGIGLNFIFQLIVTTGFWLTIIRGRKVPSLTRFMFFCQICGLLSIFVLSDFGHLAARLGNVLFSFYPFMLLLTFVEVQKNLEGELKLLLKIVFSSLFVLSLYARDTVTGILEVTRINF